MYPEIGRLQDEVRSRRASRLDIVIPGAQKAGTTSLLDALGAHPDIVRHASTEFSPLLQPTVDLVSAVEDRLPVEHGQLRLAKSAGFMYAIGGLARLREHNPDARLIFMLREPVSRMYSAFWFARRTGNEPIESFADAMAAEKDRYETSHPDPHVAYRHRSDYVTPLREAVKHFGRDRVKIVLLEDYSADRVALLEEIQTWLGTNTVDLSHTPAVSNPATTARSTRVAQLVRGSGPAARLTRWFLPRQLRRRAHATVNDINERQFSVPSLDPLLRDQLTEEFASHNGVLRSEFGLDLSRWDRD